jgi:hypothetical protein
MHRAWQSGQTETVQLGPWTEVDRSRRLKFFANQGLATVVGSDGSTSLVFRGSYSVPRRLKGRGWIHIGDPDSSQRHVFDCYQGSAGATSKLFEVTTPTGEQFDYEHRLEGDEQFNNSYVAVSPDGQWMISGEWGVMRRILVFPTPILNPRAAGGGGALPLAATIDLDRGVRNVQGATFLNDTRLVCSTDDPGTDLWPTPRQLLQIDLSEQLGQKTVEGHVTSFGQLPSTSLCPGDVEVEGLDYDVTTGDLRVVVVPPSVCGLLALVHRFRQLS